MTNATRRSVLAGLASLATLKAHDASAESYPTKPVSLIVPWAPGGSTDILARIVGQHLYQSMGQPIVIENRTGAAGNIGTSAVARAPADGYTLLFNTMSVHTMNHALFATMPFDGVKDFSPISLLAYVTNTMVVHPSVPANNVAEFIAYAKANPGKINMGSAGPGSSPHLYGELFKAMTGVDMVTVHYRGDAPTIPELIAGRIQVMFGSVVTWIEQIKAGTVRALAVTSATRTQLLPDLPPLGEFVPGYEGVGWQGIGAPKNTPADIIDKLNSAINAGLAEPKYKSRFTDLGAEIFAGSPADFGRFIVDYTEKWAPVIRAAGVKAE
jgi:tripartite-type tricarboxylate transporter receptor subunit TctC